MDVNALCDELEAEHDALDALVGSLDALGWATPTPAAGWDVSDTISHLNYYDESARLAIVDPDAFKAHAAALLARETAQDADVALGRSGEPPALYDRWRAGRVALLSTFRSADPSARVPWYGPSMSLASFITARMMETWAHGQDVVDALGAPPVVSDRLRNICHIGVNARPYAFMVHKLDDPGDPVRVEAKAPSGATWSWGDENATNRVVGTALDLALVFTQRRNLADTDVAVEGPVAAQWMAIAQSFAGPAGSGRAPGMRKLSQ